MGKPLLYAFGGLPVALLGVLLAIGHEAPALEEPQTTETLTPATPLTPEIDDGRPVSIPAEVKPSPERIPRVPDGAQSGASNDDSPAEPPPAVVTDDVAAKLPPEFVAPPPGQIDDGDAMSPPRSPASETPGAIAKQPAETVKPPGARVDGSDETADLAPAPITPRDAPTTTVAVAEPPPVAAEPPIFGNDRPAIAASGPAAESKKSGHVTIQSGNTLWRLSRVIYGQGRDYVTIAEANRDIIRDPALIYPGQVIAIPGATPPEKIDPRRKRPLPPTDGSLSRAQ